MTAITGGAERRAALKEACDRLQQHFNKPEVRAAIAAVLDKADVRDAEAVDKKETA